MGAGDTTGEVENVACKVAWTTGDPEKDWTRYQVQFDRIDQGVRHRLACLLAFDGFLILALSGERSADVGFNITFELMVLWLGFVVSLVLYWSQYRALCHRRYLCEGWTSIYPDVQPAPCGYERFEGGSPAVAPSALIALLSAILWLVMTGVTLGWKLAPAEMISQNGVFIVVRIGVLIATGVALVALYLLIALHVPSRGPE